MNQYKNKTEYQIFVSTNNKLTNNYFLNVLRFQPKEINFKTIKFTKIQNKINSTLNNQMI